METGKTERLAKEILAGSRLEITQPGFNSSIMQKIFLAERKKAMRHALLCWFLALCSLGVILFLAVLTIYENNASPIQWVEDISRKTALLVTENLFVTLLSIVLFILYKLTNRKKISQYLPDLNFE